MSELGVVVIGRNEGERLVRCLRSVAAGAGPVVYVDSGSTDGSLAAARAAGAEAVSLDMSRPFTAARARNTGLRRLLDVAPGVEFVQFVDGDCEVAPGWLAAGARFLRGAPRVAAVCGRLRERDPDRSAYNRLCDMEWDQPAGEVDACGGIALMRVGPLAEAGGFDDGLAAGEEPELCLRLRRRGWGVVRLADEMAVHDAAMTRFGQWWRRAVRTGRGMAEVAARTGRGPDGLWRREVRSNWFWAALLPAAVLLAAALASPWALLLLPLGYAALGAKVYRGRRRRGDRPADARLYALFGVLAKFPMTVGQARFHRDRLLGRTQTLIEYKGAAAAARVAYLINQYPYVSLAFVRREIAGVEAAGLPVARFTVRRTAIAVVDPGDRAEAARTRAILDGALTGLTGAVLLTALTRPVRLLRAAARAWWLGRRSGNRLKAFVYLAEACRLRRWLAADRVGHLHAHFGTNAADVALLCHVLGGPPFSFTVHGPEEFDRPDALSLGDKIAAARFVVGVSSFGRSQLFRWARPADWPKVRVVHCGVDAAFLAGGPRPLPAASRMVCVGRLTEQKGQLILIEAAARLAAAGVPFELVLAGDGPMRPEVEAAVAGYKLGDRVRITGWISSETVRNELLAARVMVLPSFGEGLPVVIMEALALGRPVVTTYIAGIPELVRDGVNGWLVPAGDPAALADAIAAALAADDARLAEMGRVGADAVRTAHDARAEAAKLAGLFAESLGRPLPTPPGDTG